MDKELNVSSLTHNDSPLPLKDTPIWNLITEVVFEHPCPVLPGLLNTVPHLSVGVCIASSSLLQDSDNKSIDNKISFFIVLLF